MQSFMVYLPENRLCSAWGNTVVSAGLATTPAGAPYPERNHPDDHYFDPAHGRILENFQMIAIHAGRGSLRTAPDAPPIELEAGQVFFIFPGRWHSYAPSPETGWTENWIECHGEVVSRLMAMDYLCPERPVAALSSAAETIFLSINALAADDPILHQAHMSTLALQLLAELCAPTHDLKRANVLAERAKVMLSESTVGLHQLPLVAKELGVSYSYLRRVFSDQAGMSLKVFQTEVRMRRARDLLVNSDKSVKEIALLLGFSSGHHFSNQFHADSGETPSTYRSRVREQGTAKDARSMSEDAAGPLV